MRRWLKPSVACQKKRRRLVYEQDTSAGTATLTPDPYTLTLNPER